MKSTFQWSSIILHPSSATLINNIQFLLHLHKYKVAEDELYQNIKTMIILQIRTITTRPLRIPTAKITTLWMMNPFPWRYLILRVRLEHRRSKHFQCSTFTRTSFTVCGTITTGVWTALYLSTPSLIGKERNFLTLSRIRIKNLILTYFQ